jgi:hypothetical protein
VKDENFKDYYFVGLVLNKEMPTAEDMKKNLDKAPNNKILKQAVKLLKAIKPEDREKFNKLWKALLEKVAACSEGAVA